MNALGNLPGLQINSPFVTKRSTNFRPNTWPPADDFPVVLDNEGRVVSRYADPTWRLWPWAGKALTLSFGDGSAHKGMILSPQNAALLRQITAWWLWGPNAIQSPLTLRMRHILIKPLFAVCTEQGKLASDLWRYPKVIEEVAGRQSRAHAHHFFSLLHGLWTEHDKLGFVILDEAGLKQLAGLLRSEHEVTQTAYIPPRIWTYQALRLRKCLDDYLGHKDKIEACFLFCLAAYSANGWNDGRAFGRLKQHHKPFEPSIPAGHKKGKRCYYGRFRMTAERFGVDALLDDWVDFGEQTGITAFSTYFNLVCVAGLAYTLNFSLMRVDEGAQLRVGCYSVEPDHHFGDNICLIGGVSSKTVQDDDARWIVSPSVKVAIDVMSSVAKLRMLAAQHDPQLRLSQDYLQMPPFQCRPHEPWSPARGKTSKARRNVRSYASIVELYPKLFDLQQMRITKTDLDLARRMTFGLDPEIFAIGNVWPLAWHQLRRTGACNMLSTGLVSEGALQFQLKHASRAMSRYYGQNHYNLKGRLDGEVQGYYLREMYQAVVREFSALRDEQYVSPYGATRKTQILSPITEKDHKALLKDAENGSISYRPTFLGGCAKPGPPCPLGGISNITGCVGHGSENACEWALIDRNKRAVIENLRQVFRAQLGQAPPGSPLEGSLKAQIESAERALHVIDTI